MYMIQTKADLKYYLKRDLLQNKITQNGGVRKWLYIHLNPRLRFIYNLRYYEYYHYRHRSIFNTIMKAYHYYVHKRLSYKLGFTIYTNNFGPGLYIGHYGTIVVNKNARIGKDCTINVDVNIGGWGGIPSVRDNVYIAPKLKIFNGVWIGNNDRHKRRSEQRCAQ